MWHKPCRTFHPWCPCIKTRCLTDMILLRHSSSYYLRSKTIHHYNDAIMGAIASQITSLTSVYSIVYSGADQRKHQSSASLAFVRGIHRGPVNSPHKWPVTRKMFPFDDVIMMLSLSIVGVWWRLNAKPGPLFTKRTDVLSQDLVKSRSCEIRG